MATRRLRAHAQPRGVASRAAHRRLRGPARRYRWRLWWWKHQRASDKLAIKLSGGGRLLSGTVSDATGGPIAGAQIDAARINTVAAPGDAVSTTLSGRVEVKPNEAATLDVTLASNAIVIGKLVDAAGGPLAGQGVALVPDSGDGHVQIQLEGPPPTARPDGSFRLEHRAEKAILVVMRPPRPFTRRGLVLEAGKTLDLGTITVDTPGAGSGSSPRP